MPGTDAAYALAFSMRRAAREQMIVTTEYKTQLAKLRHLQVPHPLPQPNPLPQSSPYLDPT
eukprot:1648543-Rhodomonas_salina.2